MMSPFSRIGLIAAFVLSIVLMASFYTVQEGQRALILRLGELTRQPDGSPDGSPVVKGPGLHFKVPFIYTARLFDIRMQTSELERASVVTKQKMNVLVDAYVKWRIKDLPLYYIRTGSGGAVLADALLKQTINDSLFAEFGLREIKEILSKERSDIMKRLRKTADQSAQSLGIEIVDVRIQGIDFPEAVSNAVYASMRTKRAEDAMLHRSTGRAEAEKIRASADIKALLIRSEAEKKARLIQAQGDAAAAAIYAQAYQRDPEFFAFLRSMKTYERIFQQGQDVFVLGTENSLSKYLLHSGQ